MSWISVRQIPLNFKEFIASGGPQDKQRPIIARFLRYSYRELVMSRAKKLRGKGQGISADLPKDIANRRKESMLKFKKAKE